MCASSLDAARYLAKTVANSAVYADKCNKGVVVGGMGSSSEKKLTSCQIQLIKESQDCLTEAEVIEHGYAFRSLFKPLHCPGSDGMLYRKGENLLIKHNGTEMVCKCLQFLCVSIGQDKQFHTFIECEKYNSLEGPDGSVMTDLSTGYGIVALPAASRVIVPVSDILRKVILYPRADDQQSCTVIDFQRHNLPRSSHEVIVPFYPAVDDMIWINGSDPEPWLAKVLTVLSSTKTVRVHYYISNGDNYLYIPEPNQRLGVDRVHWDTILGNARGEWRGHQWERFDWVWIQSEPPSRASQKSLILIKRPTASYLNELTRLTGVLFRQISVYLHVHVG